MFDEIIVIGEELSDGILSSPSKIEGVPRRGEGV